MLEATPENYPTVAQLSMVKEPVYFGFRVEATYEHQPWATTSGPNDYEDF